jgi:hypothetical protein
VMVDPLSNETLGAGMIVDIEGKEETRGQVTSSERLARFGHTAAIASVENFEAALLLERELFDRGASVAVVESADEITLSLAQAGGLLVLATGTVPAGAIDLKRLGTHVAIRQLVRRGLLAGHEEQLIQGEGI